MQDLRDNSCILNIVYVGGELLIRVLQEASKAQMITSGYGWIITKDYLLNNVNLVNYSLPEGLLVMEKRVLMHRDIFLTEMLKNLIDGTVRLQNEFQCGNDDDDSSAALSIRSEHNAAIIADIKQETEPQSITFDVKNSRMLPNGSVIWHHVGTVVGTNVTIGKVVWPGGEHYSPYTRRGDFLLIATKPAPPFVQVRVPQDGDQTCDYEIPCIEIKYPDRLVEIIDDYKHEKYADGKDYIFMCCSGLSIDLLEKLASELKFTFLLYMLPKSVNRIGVLKNGTWDGVIGHVHTHVADAMIGAFSVTASRSQYIDFTSPFYYSGYSMLAVQEEKVPTIDAFMQPFSVVVWLGVAVAASLTAIATSLLEWNSPYGLNPWGRKRKKNYTLGSALNMVWSVLFGHTVSTKSPKSWPSKVVQNVWSFFAIIIVAHYTANLAAFMAGRPTLTYYKNIMDKKLLSIRVAVIGEASATTFLKNLNPALYEKAVKMKTMSSSTAIEKLKNGEIQVFLHDQPILDYARSKLDSDCSLRFVINTIGDDSYAIGVAKNSHLKDKLSEYILMYRSDGYLEQLSRKHFYQLQCSRIKGATNIKYSLQHTGGLFVMLVVAVGVSFLLLFAEHLFFKHALPKIRLQRDQFPWRSPHVLFFSQRLYRSVTSEELVSPTLAAQEMVQIVKQRDFIRLFQKEVHQEEKRIRDLLAASRNKMDLNKVAHMAIRDMQERRSIADALCGGYSSVDSIACEEPKAGTELQQPIETADVHVSGDVKPTDDDKIADFTERLNSDRDSSSDSDEDRVVIEPTSNVNNPSSYVKPHPEEIRSISNYDISSDNNATLETDNHSFHSSYHVEPAMSAERGSINDINSTHDHESNKITFDNPVFVLNNGVEIECEGTETVPTSVDASPDGTGSRFKKSYSWAPGKRKGKSMCASKPGDQSSGIQRLPTVTGESRARQRWRFRQNDIPNRLSPVKHPYLKSNQSTKEGYYGKRPHLKDNRMKSTIRRKTLETLSEQFAVENIDAFTMETLTKEELLILCRASQIDLKRKLLEVTRQRDSLRTLLVKGSQRFYDENVV